MVLLEAAESSKGPKTKQHLHLMLLRIVLIELVEVNGVRIKRGQ